MALKVWSFGAGLTSEDLNGNFSFVIAMLNALIPVGKIMYFDDNNGANIIDTGYWAAMNGQTISDGDSAYDGVTLQDLSGRYIVGYGEDGDGNIASASWSAVAVGNTSHQVNLSHSHSPGTLKFITATLSGYELYMYNSSGVGDKVLQNFANLPSGGGLFNIATAGVNRNFYTTSGGGSTDSGGSSTQSIQPRSIKMRAYLRFK